MEPYLPHRVIYRQKKGFPVPIRQWFQEGLARLAQELVITRQSATSNFINMRAASDMLNAHQSGRIDASDELWSLVVLEQWFKTFEVSV